VSVDLDELQRETEKLLALLRDRHPGLITWSVAVGSQVSKLRQLISAIGLAEYEQKFAAMRDAGDLMAELLVHAGDPLTITEKAAVAKWGMARKIKPSATQPLHDKQGNPQVAE
jgi:hypothetical protein